MLHQKDFVDFHMKAGFRAFLFPMGAKGLERLFLAYFLILLFERVVSGFFCDGLGLDGGT